MPQSMCRDWPPINLEEYKGVWVGVQIDEGEVNEASLQLIGAARDLADKLETYVGAVMVGYNIKHLAMEPIYYGADKVFVVDDELYGTYYPMLYAQAMYELANKYKP